ncbi:hypothetical protein GGI35DRAFT_446450 [Trichoderma velutinum]
MNCTSIIGYSSSVSSAQFPSFSASSGAINSHLQHPIITTDGHIQVASDDTLNKHLERISPVLQLRQLPLANCATAGSVSPTYPPLNPHATPPPASRNFWACPGTFESRIPHSRSPAPIVTSHWLAAFNSDPRNIGNW